MKSVLRGLVLSIGILLSGCGDPVDFANLEGTWVVSKYQPNFVTNLPTPSDHSAAIYEFSQGKLKVRSMVGETLCELKYETHNRPGLIDSQANQLWIQGGDDKSVYCGSDTYYIQKLSTETLELNKQYEANPGYAVSHFLRSLTLKKISESDRDTRFNTHKAELNESQATEKKNKDEIKNILKPEAVLIFPEEITFTLEAMSSSKRKGLAQLGTSGGVHPRLFQPDHEVYVGVVSFDGGSPSEDRSLDPLASEPPKEPFCSLVSAETIVPSGETAPPSNFIVPKNTPIMLESVINEVREKRKIIGATVYSSRYLGKVLCISKEDQNITVEHFRKAFGKFVPVVYPGHWDYVIKHIEELLKK